jgi:hypothetical protein
MNNNSKNKTDYIGYLNSVEAITEEKIWVCSKELKAPRNPARLEKELLGRTGKSLGDGTEEVLYQKAFEQDHWLGLADVGSSYAEAESLLSKWIGQSGLGGYLSSSDLRFLKTTTERLRQEKLWALAPPNEGEAGFDAAVAQGRVAPATSLLALATEEPDESVEKAVVVSYTGSLHYSRYFCELILDEYWSSLATMYLQLGRYTLNFEIHFKDAPNKSRIINRFVSQLLSTIYWSGRPLRSYNATFFLPIPCLSDSRCYSLKQGLKKKSYSRDSGRGGVLLGASTATPGYRTYSQDEIDSQIVNYFSPRIREQLFYFEGSPDNRESGIQPFHEYEIQVEESVALDDCSKELCAVASLDRVSLFRHHLGQDILAFQLTAEIPDEAICSWMNYESADGVNWWHDLFERGVQIERFQWESWLHLSRLFRVIYPGFLEQWQENKIAGIRAGEEHYPFPEGIMGKLNGLVEKYLKEFYEPTDATGASTAILNGSRDDRMFVSVCYCLAGEAPPNRHAELEYERLFQTALHIDRQMDAGVEGSVYSPAFSEEKSESQVYRRWAHLGTLFGLTDHSMVCAGFGKFVRENIASLDMPYLYSRLSLINLSYKSLFHYFEYKISERTPAVNNADCALDSRLKKLRRRFMEFTNRYWFHDVTEQQQGKDLYRMQSRQFGLEILHGEIQAEVEKTHEHELARWRDCVSSFGLFFSFIALSMGLWASDGFKNHVYGHWLELISSHVSNKAIYEQSVYFMGGSVSFLVSLVVVVFLGRALGAPKRNIRPGKLASGSIAVVAIPFAGAVIGQAMVSYEKSNATDLLIILSLVVTSVALLAKMFSLLSRNRDSMPLHYAIGLACVVMLLSLPVAVGTEVAVLVSLGILYILAYLAVFEKMGLARYAMPWTGKKE